MSAAVLRSGFLTTVQDAGRTGFRQFGVSPTGALDTHAARVANLLTGNDDDASLLEVTLGGLRLRFTDERLAAWCGGSFAVRIGEILVPPGRACRVRPMDELSFGGAESGCRAWLAISGGVDVPRVLGSRSTDLRAGFGGIQGRALRDGDRLPLGAVSPRSAAIARHLRDSRIANWGAPGPWAVSATRHPMLRIVRGAEWERFTAEARSRLHTAVFTVTSDSDRMGARLDGPLLAQSDGGGDLISEAVTPGTIQVPANGRPILLLADCQTIGGYPKLAHVIIADLPVAAQLRPGDEVRFREVTLAEAHRALLAREGELERFRVGLTLRAP